MTYAPPPGWNPPPPAPPRRGGAKVVVAVIVAALVVGVVPAVLVFLVVRGSGVSAVTALPEDLCEQIQRLVSTPPTTGSIVQNSLEDRKYARCLASSTGDLRLADIGVVRMADTSSSFGSSRADDVVGQFCDGAAVGTSSLLSLMALQGPTTCAETVLEADGGLLSVAVAGHPDTQPDVAVTIRLRVVGDDADRDAAVRRADDLAAQIVALL